MFDVKIGCTGDLGVKVIRGNGESYTAHESSGFFTADEFKRKLGKPISFFRNLYQNLRRDAIIPATMTFLAFMAYYLGNPQAGAALVTTVGANYMAADFLAASTARINAFNYHDCGTGTTAAAVGDSALVTAFGGARVAGTQSTPTAGQYRTVATFTYEGNLAITEWGLFSKSTPDGVLWDRRVFASVGVQANDSIQFTYTLTVTAGGS